MPGCTAGGFQGSHVEPVWKAYPGLAFQAAFHLTAVKPPAGLSWLPLLIGLPIGLALMVCRS